MSASETPRVYASGGGGNCPLYSPGHNTHWIPAIRKYVDSPRQDVSIRFIEGQEFEVAFDGQLHRWFYHDPELLARLIEHDPTNFAIVADTTFINFNWFGTEGRVAWFYMGEEPIGKCASKPLLPDYEY